jgi:hypothetical protein
MVIEEEPFGIARTRKPALGIVALAISGGAVALAIDAAFLMLADTGDSGGSQFVLALRASTLAALTIVAAICLSVTAILQRQGRVFGWLGLGVAVLGAIAAYALLVFLPGSSP